MTLSRPATRAFAGAVLGALLCMSPGGATAAPVVEYLKTLSGADRKPATQPLTADEAAALAGTYAFGPNPTDRLVVAAQSTAGSGPSLTIAHPSGFPRGLAHLGDRAFYPAGATAVRIRFISDNGKLSVSVFDPDVIVTAQKAG